LNLGNKGPEISLLNLYMHPGNLCKFFISISLLLPLLLSDIVK